MLFLLLITLVGSIQAYSDQFHDIHKHIITLANNPLTELKSLEYKIGHHATSLSLDERKELINELQILKKNLCKRPGTRLLVLPLLVTAYFGVSSYLDYYKQTRIIAKSLTLQLLLQGKTDRSFLFNFSCFITGCIANLFIQAEHNEAIASLFAKERTIEKAIDRLIALLK